jgi:prepilin-type N-terminal cleavage/methylation domain-containing protein
MQSKGSENGFSLIEVTVALTIITLILGVAFSVLSRFQVNYRYELGYVDAQRNGRFAIARLSEIIRSAGTNPTGKTAVNWLTFVDFGGGSSSSTLTLKSDLDGDGATTSTLTSDADVIIASENVTLRLNTSTNTVEMVDNNQPTTSPRRVVPIAENIRSVTFSDPDGTRREIDVTLSAVAAGIPTSDPQYREVEFTTTIRLRNR